MKISVNNNLGVTLIVKPVSLMTTIDLVKSLSKIGNRTREIKIERERDREPHKDVREC